MRLNDELYKVIRSFMVDGIKRSIQIRKFTGLIENKVNTQITCTDSKGKKLVLMLIHKPNLIQLTINNETIYSYNDYKISLNDLIFKGF